MINKAFDVPQSEPHPDRCHAYAMEGFCGNAQWQHHHRCNGNHTNGPGGIELHYCGCSATFYFIEDAVKALVEKVFPSGV
jgi:hypothetical protein